MKILRSIQAVEKAPDTTRFVFGVAVPTHITFAAPVPPMPETRDDRGVVGVQQPAVQARGAPFVSPRVLAWLWARAPRHRLGTPATDAAQRERRLRAFNDVLLATDGGFGRLGPNETTATVLSTVRPEHAPFVAGMVASVACAYGLAVEDVVGALMREGFDHPHEAIEAMILSALEGGAFFEWDIEGRKLDDAFEVGEEDARARAADAARKEKVLTAPNKSTLDELCWVGIKAKKPPTPKMILPWNVASTALPPALAVLPRVAIDDAHYLFFPKVALARIELPVGIVALGVEILRGDFVPKCTVRDIDSISEDIEAIAWHGEGANRRMTDASFALANWVLDEVWPAFGIDISADAPKVTFDETTEHGRYRAELYDAFLSEHDELLVDAKGKQIFDLWMQIAFDAGLRGLSLDVDVTASIMWRHLHERWFASQSKTVEDRRASVPQVPWEPKRAPEWLASSQAFLDKRNSKKTRHVFKVDALYTNPDPGLLERLRDVLTIGDPWVVPLKALVANHDVLRSVDIEKVLREAGEITTSLKSAQHERVSRIMLGLGWRKTTHAIVDGVRCKAWERKKP